MRDYAVMANAAIRRYQMALILIIETTLADYRDTVEQRAAKKHQNLLTELLMEQLRSAYRPTAWTRKKWPTPLA